MLVAKILLFTVVAPGTVTLLLPWWILGQPPWAVDAGGPRAWLGLAWVAAGACVYARCAWDFGRAQGTPAPIDPPLELVVAGLYRFSRNPMYVGVLSVVLGVGLYTGEIRLLLYAGVVFGCFHAFVLFYEEPALRRQFGPAYDRYRARVPRWLGLPREAAT